MRWAPDVALSGSRSEHDMRCAVAPGTSELMDDSSVRRETQALRRERRAGDIAAQVLQTVAIVRGDAHRGVLTENPSTSAHSGRRRGSIRGQDDRES